MKTFQTLLSYLTTTVVYLLICVWCGFLAHSLMVFANSQTTFNFYTVGEATIVGTALSAKEKKLEDYDEYWRCPSCGGLVNPEVEACGCGFNR